ncbi:chemotaxis protein CheC [Clostridium gasigenes]|uniref:Chemotaxis protein CheC n=1 Tax=Clostridium gasigenes TaxID=94869 RepID=A0A7X0SGK1_9CLOT|nr:chemotaxis protein CheC [Clostridium gasigenes]
MNYSNLNPLQLDALREVSNIGAGNSATALSILFSQKIDMAVPNVDIIKFDKLLDNYGEHEVVAVLVRVLGELSGSVLYIFEKDVAFNIVEKLTGSTERNMDEMAISVISEIGNIISSSFMNAISQFINVEAIVSVPAVANDMISAILISTFIEAGQYDEDILEIETNFIGDESSKITGHFYYVPGPGALEQILKSLGIA